MHCNILHNSKHYMMRSKLHVRLLDNRCNMQHKDVATKQMQPSRCNQADTTAVCRQPNRQQVQQHPADATPAGSPPQSFHMLQSARSTSSLF